MNAVATDNMDGEFWCHRGAEGDRGAAAEGSIEMADGHSSVEQSKVTKTATLRIGQHKELVQFTTAPLKSSYDALLGIPWLQDHDPAISWSGKELLLRYSNRRVVVHAFKIPEEPSRAQQSSRQSNRAKCPTIQLVSAQKMLNELKCKGTEAILYVLREIKPTANQDEREQDAQIQQVLREFNDVFVDGLPAGLPPKRSVDHKIELIAPDLPPPHRPCYKMSPLELQESRKQVEEYLQKGYIRPSVSPYGAPILFSRKKNGKLRMCIDYRALNGITKRNNYPIPRIDELLESLQGARYFTKIDLVGGYHQIRVAEEDVPKTAFNTRYGHYEWLVMSFGLTNAPATFQGLMNDVFRDMLGMGLIVYLDDILIYTKTKEEHLERLRCALQRLRQHKLYAQIAKCEFLVNIVEYLGDIVDAEGIRVDPAKVRAAEQWPTPTTVKELQSFLGLANYYRKFVLNFAHHASPLTNLLQQSHQWIWTEEQDKAF